MSETVIYFIIYPLFVFPFMFRTALAVLFIDVLSRNFFVKKYGKRGSYIIPAIIFSLTLLLIIVAVVFLGVPYMLVIALSSTSFIILVIDRVIVSLYKQIKKRVVKLYVS